MPDTLTTDTSRIAAWINSGKYDYAQQLAQPERSWMKELGEWVQDFLQRAQDNFVTWNSTQIVAFVVGVLLLCLIIYWFWCHRYQWVGGIAPKVSVVKYEVSEDNIYGINFDEAISQALADQNYDEAVRLIYLRHLRRLSDAQKIVWQPQRTPNAYLAELQQDSDREALRRVTEVYVHVRFGHYSATRAQVENLLNEEGGRP